MWACTGGRGRRGGTCFCTGSEWVGRDAVMLMESWWGEGDAVAHMGELMEEVCSISVETFFNCSSPLLRVTLTSPHRIPPTRPPAPFSPKGPVRDQQQSQVCDAAILPPHHHKDAGKS